jgi:hypothetical protein
MLEFLRVLLGDLLAGFGFQPFAQARVGKLLFTANSGRIVACCTADLRSPGAAIAMVYRFNGSRQPPRISISACPPAQADSADSADAAAIAGSVWVASLIVSTMSAIGLGSAAVGKSGICTAWVSGIGSPSNRNSSVSGAGPMSLASIMLCHLLSMIGRRHACRRCG